MAQAWTIYNQNEWYPVRPQQMKQQQACATGESPAPDKQSWFKPVVILLFLVSIGLSVGTLVYVYMTNSQARGQPPGPGTTPTPALDTCEDLAGFWPCGIAAGDIATFNYDQVDTYQTQPGVSYNMFGTASTAPVMVDLYCDRGYVQLEARISSGGGTRVRVAGSHVPAGQYDAPDAAKNQYCFRRQASAADLAAINCAIAGFTPTEAYVFTWLRYSYGNNNVGTFQVIVAFAGDKAFSLSNYHTDLESSGAVPDGQFHVYDDDDYTYYETTTTVDDVKGKRTAFALGNDPTAPNLDNAPLTGANCLY